MESYIHHIEWCVKDINKTVNCLTTQYGFTLISERQSFNNNCKKSGNCVVYQKATVKHVVSCLGRVEKPSFLQRNCSAKAGFTYAGDNKSKQKRKVIALARISEGGIKTKDVTEKTQEIKDMEKCDVKKPKEKNKLLTAFHTCCLRIM